MSGYLWNWIGLLWSRMALPGARSISFLVDLILMKEMSFTGSKSLLDDTIMNVQQAGSFYKSAKVLYALISTLKIILPPPWLPIVPHQRAERAPPNKHWSSSCPSWSAPRFRRCWWSWFLSLPKEICWSCPCTKQYRGQKIYLPINSAYLVSLYPFDRLFEIWELWRRDGFI